jgi:hypothetical protein
MPELREKVMSIICEEWPEGDIPLNPTTIRQRLRKAGVRTSEGEVRLRLEQLRRHCDINTSLEPGGPDAPTVVGVNPELCS